MRLDALANASRRDDQFVKANFVKHQGLFPSQQKQWEIE